MAEEIQNNAVWQPAGLGGSLLSSLNPRLFSREFRNLLGLNDHHEQY